MELSLKHWQQYMDGEPGDHAVIQISQLGEDKSANDSTDVIIETEPNGGDIRISDGERVVTIRMNQSFEIEGMLENDVWIPEPE